MHKICVNDAVPCNEQYYREQSRNATRERRELARQVRLVSRYYATKRHRNGFHIFLRVQKTIFFKYPAKTFRLLDFRYYFIFKFS